MLKSKQEAYNSTYDEGSNYTVQLAAGEKGLHVDNLNDTLVSFGQLCNDRRIVAFTANEAIILNLTEFRVSVSAVIEFVLSDNDSGIYEFTDGRMNRNISATNKSGLKSKRSSNKNDLLNN